VIVYNALFFLQGKPQNYVRYLTLKTFDKTTTYTIVSIQL